MKRYKEIFRTHQQEAVQENFDAVTLARTHAHKNGPINKHTHARSHTHTHAHTHTHTNFTSLRLKWLNLIKF